MIPIDDSKWRRIPPDDLEMLPGGHYAEWARGDDGTLVARIVGPHAHVYGQGTDTWAAILKALEWFESCGGEL